MKRKERVNPRNRIVRCRRAAPGVYAPPPVGDIDGFPRFLRFLALPAVDGKTLRHLQTWINATQPTSDGVSKLVENRMRSLKRVSRQVETRLGQCSGMSPDQHLAWRFAEGDGSIQARVSIVILCPVPGHEPRLLR